MAFPALFKKLFKYTGGGYVLLDSVLSDAVDREVARYISSDGLQGYVKHASGLILAWSLVTVYRGPENDTTWSVIFPTPFTQAPVTWVSGYSFNVRIFALSIGK
jgi:hypothetical protein